MHCYTPWGPEHLHYLAQSTCIAGWSSHLSAYQHNSKTRCNNEVGYNAMLPWRQAIESNPDCRALYYSVRVMHASRERTLLQAPGPAPALVASTHCKSNISAYPYLKHMGNQLLWFRTYDLRLSLQTASPKPSHSAKAFDLAPLLTFGAAGRGHTHVSHL